jgi:hypothetical protein
LKNGRLSTRTLRVLPINSICFVINFKCSDEKAQASTTFSLALGESQLSASANNGKANLEAHLLFSSAPPIVSLTIFSIVEVWFSIWLRIIFIIIMRHFFFSKLRTFL